MSEILETYEVEAGTVLFVGTSYFKVTEVKEPSHPALPGLVFEGHYFDTRRNVWGPKTKLNAWYGEKWRPAGNTSFPDVHFSAYLKPGDLAIVKGYDNGSSVWSPEVKCKVVEFGEKESRVKITGDSYQFDRGELVTLPSQRLYRRKVKK